ncbi:MAG: hypothetical protein GC159_04540 [Phycisphaera sp.]|nr:hypothetical protein [Phycisphaera sp.]
MTDETEQIMWRAWRDQARDAEIDAALRTLFDELDAAVTERGPTCWISGRCCQFDSFEHRLYVTGLEIAWLVSQLDDAQRATLDVAPLPDVDGCPFQHDKLCGVRTIRPLGCRVFFCDPSAQSWQNPLYESFLDRLRALHEAHRIEYRYMEWRSGLDAARRAL